MSANQKRVAESLPTTAAVNPAFPGQHEGEEVIFTFRQHPAVMRKALIFGLFAIVLAVLPLDFPFIYSRDWIAPLILKIDLLVFFAVIGGWFYAWMKWYYSINIVTVERIIEIHQNSFFKRDVRALFHGRIHALDYKIGSIDAAIFHYGSIEIMTEVGNFSMRMIPHPERVHEQILEAIRNNRDRFDDSLHND
jgi:hypothetical protein